MINIIISVLLVVVTIYVALVQYRASHAPFLNVIKINHWYKRDSKYKTCYRVTVKNLGNGICLDTFLLIKEIKRENKNGEKKDVDQYYISKPTREIRRNTEYELSVKKEYLSINTIKVEYMVVYMDFFGRKYLASDVFNGELYQDGGRDNKHLERFTKKAKLLLFWSPKMLKYNKWMKKAIKQRNTALGDYEKEKQKYQLSNIKKGIISDSLNEVPLNMKQSEALKKLELPKEDKQDQETFKEFIRKNILLFIGTFFIALAFLNLFHFVDFLNLFSGYGITKEIKITFLLGISVITLSISILELDAADAKLAEKYDLTKNYTNKEKTIHKNKKTINYHKITIVIFLGYFISTISYDYILSNPKSEVIYMISESLALIIFGLLFFYYIYEYIYTGNKIKKSFLGNLISGSWNRAINLFLKIGKKIIKK